METERWPRGGFPGIRNAAGEEFLAAWAVMDPVHVVALAVGKVDECHTPVEVAWSVYLCCTIPFTPSSIAQTDSRVLQSPQSPQGPTMFSSRRCMILIISMEWQEAKRSAAYSRSRSVLPRGRSDPQIPRMRITS